MNRAGPSDHPLAMLGGQPAFSKALPVGQLYFPNWQEYTDSFKQIFARQYYTNHGPLLQELEQRLAAYFDVRHAICVTNATIGLIMAMECLNLKGKVIVPSFTFVATAQALTWANLEPVFCDVDVETHHITPAIIEPLIDPQVSAILAVNLWGGCCDAEALQPLADKHGLKLIFDSAHAFGCRVNNRPVGGFGAVEVFSFHATKVFSSAEGGCLTTNDDELAKRLRNVRSSYGAGPAVSVVKTSNGRMSEAQAAIALLNLDMFDDILRRNRRLTEIYHARLAAIPGVVLVEPRNTSRSNHQYVVVELNEDAFGLSRDALLRVLRAENIVARRYFYPGVHRTPPYIHENPQYLGCLPNTDRLNRDVLQLPIGALVTDDDAIKVCGIIRMAHKKSRELKAVLGA